MISAFKWISWVTLIGSFIIAVLVAIELNLPAHALALSILAIFCWIGWYRAILWALGIRRHVRRHLGISPNQATLLEKAIRSDRLADIRSSIEKLFKKNSDFGDASSFGVDLALGLITVQTGDAEIVNLRWLTREIQSGHFEQYPSNSVYLLSHDNIPFVARVFDGAYQSSQGALDDDSDRQSIGRVLQILARNLDDATTIVRFLENEASQNSTLRAKMVLVQPRGEAGSHRIVVSDRPRVNFDRIVLPKQVLAVMRRSIESRVKYHGLLHRNGHSSKTGILLHGAPGTGKTLLTKYWIGMCESYTTIVPAGMEAETIREAFRLAGYLQPALIVIEDADLLANRRESNANVTGLQELMNEMDGLAPSTEAIVLLSTNRPEVLEPALASRPGRVSQAIEFPLPDSESRRQLLQLFSASADTKDVAFDHWTERTNGSSPAFLEELVKKAILFSADRIGPMTDKNPIVLTDNDFELAIHELIVFGGVITTKMLGFPDAPRSEAIRSGESSRTR